MNERSARYLAGGILLGLGVFLSVSFYNVLELLLYAAAALMGIAGLVAVPVMLAKRWHKADVALAGGVGVGGIALAVHDLFPGGIILHVAAALGAFIGGGILVYQGIRMTRPRGFA